MQKIDFMLSTVEIAEMLDDTPHKDILKKLEGRTQKNGKRIKGYVEILTERQMSPSDFFIPSTYKDSSGKENKCYKVTKKGCEFLANKFTGEKGVLFTARYINRFHEMETQLETGASRELLMYLKNKLEKQEVALCNIERQTRKRGYISSRTVNTVREQFRQEILRMAESSCDTEYLQAVYTFAKHYPNKSVVA